MTNKVMFIAGILVTLFIIVEVIYLFILPKNQLIPSPNSISTNTTTSSVPTTSFSIDTTPVPQNYFAENQDNSSIQFVGKLDDILSSANGVYLQITYFDKANNTHQLQFNVIQPNLPSHLNVLVQKTKEFYPLTKDYTVVPVATSSDLTTLTRYKNTWVHIFMPLTPPNTKSKHLTIETSNALTLLEQHLSCNVLLAKSIQTTDTTTPSCTPFIYQIYVQ